LFKESTVRSSKDCAKKNSCSRTSSDGSFFTLSNNCIAAGDALTIDDINLAKHYRRLATFAIRELRRPDLEPQVVQRNAAPRMEHYAQLLLSELHEFMSFEGKLVLDVGGADGTFCKVLAENSETEAINFDHSINLQHLRWPQSIRGTADKLPFADNAFDLVVCTSVLEHVPTENQQNSLNEIFRVTKKGGLSYIAIPPWYNPFAGHVFRPFHVFPFEMARTLTLFYFKKPPPDVLAARSYAELGLFPITFRQISRMIARSGFRVVTTKDIHFRLHSLTRIPIVREVAVPSVGIIVKKPEKRAS
jgi:ubiquinone/menaquinone biosynthesis C-methylase UbiE